ncbi:MULTISPECIES: DUF397 domain-containing protein [Streptomyces]|uniref:DUF397 domain-containing protein n=1 Tax=Streptomyces TaxID=1883 RepID=UPI0019054260|nr:MULTISPECIES: DUF397 domain-containing protein [unclassified Streptomyces]MCU4745224.1 DUF397 domain-containing protein [Streptomyces sp. G-5]QQN79833.1 DUF397 domain-containing protein [Streptomyces sp. XC 2026]
MNGERPAWRKSSYSDGSGANCIEVAASCDGVQVRDTKAAQRARLSFTREQWTAFISEAVRS